MSGSTTSILNYIDGLLIVNLMVLVILSLLSNRSILNYCKILSICKSKSSMSSNICIGFHTHRSNSEKYWQYLDFGVWDWKDLLFHCQSSTQITSAMGPPLYCTIENGVWYYSFTLIIFHLYAQYHFFTNTIVSAHLVWIQCHYFCWILTFVQKPMIKIGGKFNKNNFFKN